MHTFTQNTFNYRIFARSNGNISIYINPRFLKGIVDEICADQNITMGISRNLI